MILTTGTFFEFFFINLSNYIMNNNKYMLDKHKTNKCDYIITSYNFGL